MIKSLHLLIAFWFILIVGLIFGWISFDYWLGSFTQWIILSTVLLIIGLLTVLYVLWIRKIAAQPRLTALYIVLGLWPILLLIGVWMLQLGQYVLDPTQFLPEPMWWTELWLPFIIGSLIIMGSLVYRTYRAKKNRVLLPQAAAVSSIGVILVIIILVLHAVLPTTAERVLDHYLAGHYSSYSVSKVEWYHFCCAEKLPSNPEEANSVIFTVKIPANGASSDTKYFVMGDTNRDNVIPFGQHEWSDPEEVAPSDIDSYRHF